MQDGRHELGEKKGCRNLERGWGCYWLTDCSDYIGLIRTFGGEAGRKERSALLHSERYFRLLVNIFLLLVRSSNQALLLSNFPEGYQRFSTGTWNFIQEAPLCGIIARTPGTEYTWVHFRALLENGNLETSLFWHKTSLKSVCVFHNTYFHELFQDPSYTRISNVFAPE